MMNAYEYLNAIKERLKGIKGIKTIKLGLEPTLSPSDYPILRIVGGRVEASNGFDGWGSDISFSVYFGAKIDDKKGVEMIYKALYAIEAQIKELLHNYQFEYNELKTSGGGIVKFERTLDDNDNLAGHKVLISEYVIKECR